MATIAGNFVNASPIGDLSIFFLVLDSKLTINNNRNRTRKVDLKYFFKDYKKVDLQQDEWIETIEFKVPSFDFYFNFEKLSKRTYLDIASVNSAICFEMEKGLLSNVHVAIGGVSAIPKYLNQTSDYLNSKVLTANVIKNAAEILQQEISPIDDIRGSKKYKRLLARQLFLAHFIELFPMEYKISDLL
jgi:xanthine dehydrogenase small subunit